jgi:hypothetical protein
VPWQFHSFSAYALADDEERHQKKYKTKYGQRETKEISRYQIHAVVEVIISIARD